MDENTRPVEQVPDSIGRYQVQGSIGFGAMGAVYKSFDPLIKRTLAIKTIRLDIPRQSPQYKSFIERFYHEARISGTLSHPNIVTLFDIGEESGLPYLAMEFVEGETIASILERGEKFDPERVIGLVSQVASALDYAHSKGVIHRDIKPSNLILSEGDRVKVTDFGIAKLVDAEMTQSGTLLGTPSYMSPEQAMGDKLDGRSDIFSLGICAFEMLSGEQPFPGNNVTSILYKLVHVDPIEPANLEMNGLVPQKWHEVFGKVLAKKANDRYQTAGAFVQDLEFCLGSWFGSAVPEESTAATVVLPAPGISAPGGGAATTPGTPLADVTAAIPKGALPPPAPKPETPPPPPAEAEPATILMKAPPSVPAPPAPAPAAEPATVLQPAPVPPAGKTGDRAGKNKKKDEPAPGTPAGPPAEEATVLMKAGVPPAPASEEPPATILMKGPAVPPSPPASKPPIPPPAATIRTTVPDLPTPLKMPAAPAGRSTKTPPRGQPAPPTPASGAPAVPPTRKGVASPLLLLAGGVVVLFLGLVAVGLIIYLFRGSGGKGSTEMTPAPTAATPAPAPTQAVATDAPTAAPAAANGRLRVSSNPPGASVAVNGAARGQTPLEAGELAPGTYEVLFELKGYETKTESVTVTAENPEVEVSATLVKSAPVTSVADIVSSPFGAEVKVDGKAVGTTPVTDLTLRAGNRRVELKKAGYETFSATLKVEAGKRAKLDATLKAEVKVATAPPTPDPKAVDPAKVYLETEVDTPPKKVAGLASPGYPKNAPKLKSGQSVRVSVSWVVTEDGGVTDIKILDSAGKIVDEAVIDMVEDQKYSPGLKQGTKVKVRLTRSFTFRAG